eukprot:15410056-Alexandrium_andersonii.AAC.1
MSGQSVPAGGAARSARGPPDAWAGARWGHGWAEQSFGQGRPQECSVDLRARSDAYSALDLEAQPQGYRLW